MNTRIFPSILDTIGQTKLVKLKPSIYHNSNILVKLERTNPGGSVKDRPALYLIEEAERTGKLLPNGTIIESSSGNFGISLAMIGAAKHYRVIIIVDPKTTNTNLSILKAYGAEVIVVTEKDDLNSYHKTRIALANKLHQEIPNSFRPDQCFNILNSQAHYHSTAEELLKQSGSLDYLIVGVSTGGQLGGISEYFKKYNPGTNIIAVDALGSAIFGSPSSTHSYLMPGMGLGWTPSNIQDISLIDFVYKVSDDDAFLACRLLAKHEGLLLGGSSGACFMVALSIALEVSNKNIAFIAADNGDHYLETLYNTDWLVQNGLSTNADLEDIVKRAAKLSPHSRKPSIPTNYKLGLAEELGCIQ